MTDEQGKLAPLIRGTTGQTTLEEVVEPTIKCGIQQMSMAEYLADPCPEPSFTSSATNAIISRSPLHAWHEHPRLNPNYVEEHRKAMDIGTAVHSMFLQDDESQFVIIEADDYRKADAKVERDLAYLAGKVPLLRKQYEQVQAIAEASQKAWFASELAGDDDTVEQAVLWTEGETSRLWCRSRPDLITDDRTIIVNYKTTGISAEPDSFGNGYLIRGGYHVQAYHHLRGIEVLTGVEPKYIWMVQEVDPPYACSFIGMSPSLQALAEAQWSHALSIWRECLLSGEWPGYPSQVCWIEAPVWAAKRWCERPDVEGTLEMMDILGGFAK